MSLKNKRILITAGPTWVPIDPIRIIANTATGQTGMLLAASLKKQGATVTLVLGPVNANSLNKTIRLIRFKYFNELRDKIIRELRTKKYDIIIHSAAVSDFKPGETIRKKINSSRSYNLKLVPLPKIIRDIRKLTHSRKLVIFKLEANISDRALIRKARLSQIKEGADIIIANRLNPYRAFIIDKENNQIKVQSKKDLAKKLIKILGTGP